MLSEDVKTWVDILMHIMSHCADDNTYMYTWQFIHFVMSYKYTYVDAYPQPNKHLKYPPLPPFPNRASH